MSSDANDMRRPASDELAGSLGELPGVGGLGPGFEGGGTAEPTIPPQDRSVEQRGPAPPPISARIAVLYSSGNFGSGIFYSFNNFILPFYLQGLNAPAVLIGLLSSTRSVEGSIIQPLVGAWSDRTWNRFGRRRPFILSFVPLSVLFLVLTPFLGMLAPAGNFLGLSGSALALTLASVGIFLFSVTFNIMYDPYNALLADITPERQRGTINGVFQAFGALGQVAILLIGVFLNVNITVLFLITAATLALFFVPTVLGVREPRTLPGVVGKHRYSIRDYWRGLKSDRQVQLYFAVQFFLWFGINAITPYLVLFATNEAHFTESGALILSFILLLSTALFVYPFGRLGDRLGLKRVFLLGMICMAGASIAGIFARDPLLLYGILTIAGLGNAAQTASSYPLLTRLVFPDRIGLYTGLNSTVTSIAAPASAAIAGALITAIGYKAMFPFVAAMFLLSLVPLALLRVEKSEFARAQRAAKGEVEVA